MLFIVSFTGLKANPGMEFVPRTVMIGGKVSMCIIYIGNAIFCYFIVRICASVLAGSSRLLHGQTDH